MQGSFFEKPPEFIHEVNRTGYERSEAVEIFQSDYPVRWIASKQKLTEPKQAPENEIGCAGSDAAAKQHGNKL